MPFRRLRAIPWIILFETLMVARDRWSRLSPDDRAQLTTLMRKSKGKPGNLTASERSAVRALAGKLDLFGAARDISPLGRGSRSRRRH